MPEVKETEEAEVEIPKEVVPQTAFTFIVEVSKVIDGDTSAIEPILNLT